MLTRKLESAVRENKRLQDDLLTVSRESQVLHCELDKLRIEKDSYAEKMTGMANELNRYEDILKQKDNERANHMEQFRLLSNEYNAVKIQLATCDSELGACRMDIQAKQIEIKRLRERLDKSERDYQQVN